MTGEHSLSRRKFLETLFLGGASLLLPGCTGRTPPAPSTSQQSFPGVNIHPASYTYKDLDMIRDAGFAVIRTDLLWHETEKQKGVYDFSTFDRLLPELKKREIQPLLTLAYGNPLYGCKLNTNNPECLQGFKNFARTAAARYKDYNPIWEIWNEPDVGYFWQPQPDYEGYMTLVKQVAPAIKDADPNARIIAPAVGELTPPYTFLKECFKRGLLDYVDAVSVHPYRDAQPETVIEDYENLRGLIKKHSPYRPNIPIVSGEWGISSVGKEKSEEKQTKYMLRMFLINISEGIPVSIWYKWKNDGINSLEQEQNLGLVSKNGSLPKESLKAFKQMADILKNTEFSERIKLDDPEVFVLSFRKKDSSEKLFIGWTTGQPKTVALPGKNPMSLTDMPRLY